MPHAREALLHAVYEFIAAGAGEEITKRDDEAAFGRIKLKARVLRDVTRLDTGITLTASAAVEDCLAVSQPPVWFLLYWQSDRTFNAEFVTRMAALGAKASV